MLNFHSEMPERPKGAACQAVVLETVPGVRIPLSPLSPTIDFDLGVGLLKPS